MFSGGKSASCRGVCVKRLICTFGVSFGRLAQAPLQHILAVMPNRPPRLDRVFQRYDPPLYFVTFNTHERRRILANADVHAALIRFAHEGEMRGIGLGRYVIMPDHVHLFVRGSLDFFATAVGTTAETRFINRHFGFATTLAVGVFRSSDPSPRKLFGKMGIRTAESTPGRIGSECRRLAMARRDC
jgi:hypothetical protein